MYDIYTSCMRTNPQVVCTMAHCSKDCCLFLSFPIFITKNNVSWKFVWLFSCIQSLHAETQEAKVPTCKYKSKQRSLICRCRVHCFCLVMTSSSPTFHSQMDWHFYWMVQNSHPLTQLRRAMWTTSGWVGKTGPMKVLTILYEMGFVPKPHPLMRRNGLVNRVEFFGLAHTFAMMSPSNVRQTCSKRYGYSSNILLL